MTPPKTIQIGPFQFFLVFDHAKLIAMRRAPDSSSSSDMLAYSDLTNLQIVVEPDRPAPAIKVSVMHEVIHCILWAYGIELTELVRGHEDEGGANESFVSKFDTTLLDTLRRNPKFVVWLMEG